MQHMKAMVYVRHHFPEFMYVYTGVITYLSSASGFDVRPVNLVGDA